MIIVFAVNVNAQCKTFKLTSSGDTLNCIDQNDQKRGKWVLHVDALRAILGMMKKVNLLTIERRHLA
jgi:hypothetical protein